MRIGDTVNARATVNRTGAGKAPRHACSTVVTVAGKVVLEGEAVVLVPLRAALPAKEQPAAGRPVALNAARAG